MNTDIINSTEFLNDAIRMLATISPEDAIQAQVELKALQAELMRLRWAETVRTIEAAEKVYESIPT